MRERERNAGRKASAAMTVFGRPNFQPRLSVIRTTLSALARAFRQYLAEEVLHNPRELEVGRLNAYTPIHGWSGVLEDAQSAVAERLMSPERFESRDYQVASIAMDGWENELQSQPQARDTGGAAVLAQLHSEVWCSNLRGETGLMDVWSKRGCQSLVVPTFAFQSESLNRARQVRLHTTIRGGSDRLRLFGAVVHSAVEVAICKYNIHSSVAA
ncbi:hypothetical protein DFH06DRAFT_1121998 [Mycena polygramma]|nr:hypothetical protein DFH06DRAFT_1121998 [Mycena polygramma]